MARRRERVAAVFGCDHHGAVPTPCRLGRADRQKLETSSGDQGRVGIGEAVRRDGQGEHVILSAAQGEGQWRLPEGICDFRDSGNDRDLGPVQADVHARAPRDVTQIGGQAVADVDHRSGAGRGKDGRRGELRLRPQLTGDEKVPCQVTQIRHRQPSQQSEAGRGTTDRPGHRDHVAGASPRASYQRRLVVEMGDHGDADDDSRSGDDVTTRQVELELFCRRDDAIGQPLEVLVRCFGRSSQGDQHLGGARPDPHRGDVRDRAGNRLAGDLGRRAVSPEMDPRNRGVDRGDDPAVGPDHGGVVAAPDLESIGARPTGVAGLFSDTPDQLELAQVHGSDTIARRMSEEPREEKPSLLHRLGHLAATIGKTGPRKKSTKVVLQGAVAFLIFGFLVFTVVSQWSELKDKGVEFDLVWLIPAILMMLLYYVAGAAVWGLILRFLGSPVPVMETQKIWAQPLLVRYIPGTVLFLLARILLAEKAGVQRRVSTAGLVYEQAVSVAGALTIATWFLIDHPDLQNQPARWLPLLILPVMVLLLHPRIFGPVSKRLLTALGREPLPQLMPFRGVVTIYVAYVMVWAIVGVGVFFAARAVHPLGLDDLAIVAASQMIGFLAAVVSAVTPAGLGVRDAAFAWAVKVALPSDSFGVGAVIAIAVRATQTVVELVYVGGVTALTRRPGDEDELELVEEAAGEAASPNYR